ncbi:MAG: glycosyltransferase family 1 protein [Candidatus Omnitrophota bacterium]
METTRQEKTKVCFVVRNLTHGGVYRYVKNLLLALDKINADNFEFYLIHNDDRIKGAFSNISELYVPTKNRASFDYIFSLRLLLKNKFDTVVYLKNVIPITHFFLNGRKINLVYDLGYFEKGLKAYPLTDTLFMRIFMKTSCNLADSILTISNSTKEDVHKKFNIKRTKIGVIWGGVENNFKALENENYLEDVRMKFNLSRPFLFYSGSLSPRKNVDRMLKAFELVRGKIPHDLVMSGFKTLPEKLLRMFSKDRVKVLGYVREEELVALYNMADVYLYASLYEGFGLPIIEAQSCGCPVITSGITSMPEVAGDGAVIVDPKNVHQIAASMLRIIEDEDFRSALISKGFKNAKKFSWEKCAQALVGAI